MTVGPLLAPGATVLLGLPGPTGDGHLPSERLAVEDILRVAAAGLRDEFSAAQPPRAEWQVTS